MRAVTALLCLLLLMPRGAAAQSWPSHQQTAGTISNWLVAGQIGAETTRALMADDRTHELGCYGMRLGLAMGVTEVLKRTVQRERPDHSDNLSFPSGHTAALFVSSGWKWQIGIPIAIGGGYLRVAANKHHVTDVIGGAIVAMLARRICQ